MTVELKIKEIREQMGKSNAEFLELERKNYSKSFCKDIRESV